MVTEILIALKFDWNTFTKPLPPHITTMLLVGAFCLTVWTLWHFYFQRLLHHTELKMKIIKDGEFSEGAHKENIKADGQGDQKSSHDKSTRNRKKY